MITLFGYFLALLMGLTLGLIGAGGSILTVPILVYCFHVQPVIATGYSLLVVGCAALAGAWRYYRRALVDFRAAFTFAFPAMLAVLFTRSYIVPSIPDPIELGAVSVEKDTFIMLLFALLMALAAFYMLRPLKDPAKEAAERPAVNTLKLLLGSAGIGLLTGMVGAGGGFLIIPTLIGLFRLNVKKAVATSLAIIAINSLVGFNGDVAAGIPMDWPLLGSFLSLTLAGMWLGTTFSRKVEARMLRHIFGWFVLVVACIVLVENLL